MSISSISYGSTSALDGCETSPPASSNSATDSGDVTAAAGDTSQLSGPAQLLSQLQALEKSDPAKAKEAMTQLADQIRSQAQQVGGAQAQHMNQFADALDKAADTGDLSGLQQQAAQQPHGHHHHHGGHRPAADGSSSSSDTDSSGGDATSTSSTGAGRKATHAYQSNMPSPTDMLNQILTQLNASSGSSATASG